MVLSGVAGLLVTHVLEPRPLPQYTYTHWVPHPEGVLRAHRQRPTPVLTLQLTRVPGGRLWAVAEGRTLFYWVDGPLTAEDHDRWAALAGFPWPE